MVWIWCLLECHAAVPFGRSFNRFSQNRHCPNVPRTVPATVGWSHLFSVHSVCLLRVSHGVEECGVDGEGACGTNDLPAWKSS